MSEFCLKCVDAVSHLLGMDAESVDMVLTSPPYDNIRNYKGFRWNFHGLVFELHRVLKPGGVVIWNVADQTVKGGESGTSFRQALHFMESGFTLHDTMIYYKNNPMPSGGDRYHQSWEYIFCFSKGKPKTFNPIMVEAKYGGGESNMKNRGVDGELNYTKAKRNTHTKVRNVFAYSIGGGISTRDKIAYEHPAIMPEKLAEDQILTWSNSGDVVYDPFTGSGTTAKMALLNGRKFCGSEISEEYCDLAERRLKLHGLV